MKFARKRIRFESYFYLQKRYGKCRVTKYRNVIDKVYIVYLDYDLKRDTRKHNYGDVNIFVSYSKEITVFV